MPILLVRKLGPPKVMNLPGVMWMARGRARSSGSQASAFSYFSASWNLESVQLGVDGMDSLGAYGPHDNPQTCSSEAEKSSWGENKAGPFTFPEVGQSPRGWSQVTLLPPWACVLRPE